MESNVTELPTDSIKLTNADLNNFNFQQGLSRLKTMSFTTKTAYKISYIVEHVNRHVAQGRDVFSSIAKKFAKLDENDNLIPEVDENENPIPGSFVFLNDEAQESFIKEQDEFMNIEHVIPKHKLTTDELGDTKFSPNDISALAPLFSDLE